MRVSDLAKRVPDLAGKLARRAVNAPALLAVGAMNLPPLLGYLERRHEAAIRRAPPAGGLSAVEAAVVEGLDRDGVFVTSLAALGLAEESGDGIMSTGRRVADALACRAEAMGGGRVMITTHPTDIVQHPAIYRWGLNPVLLRILRAYLRLPVAYDGPILFHTPADGAEAGTRRWHIDREDRRVVKVGLYLHDVDEHTGPFQSLRREVRPDAGRFDFTALDTAGLRRRFGADEGSPDITTCVGAAGTVIFADTARFYHRGKPATRRARSAVFYSYFARPPRHPFFCERSRLSRPRIAAMVRSLSPEQQDCALWRDSLPWLARLIPSSAL